jgi:hypothetical protein
MFSVGKITKYWLILFKIEVKKLILFVPMTGKKLINGHILKNVCVFYVNASHFVSVFYVNAIVILFVNVMVEKLLQSKYPYL